LDSLKEFVNIQFVHIVEELIAERAPKLMSRPRLFKLVKPLTGHVAFQRVARHINPRTAVVGLSNIPSKGACILIANHPTGLADGLAVFQAIRDRRPDHIFLANADALRVIPHGEDIIIPVEWVKDKRNHTKTRETLLVS